MPSFFQSTSRVLRLNRVQSLTQPCLVAAALFVASFAHAGEVTAPPAEEVKRLDLDTGFYKKYLSVNGFPVVASANVSDYALKEAEFLILKMLGDRPDIMEGLVEAKIRFSIMSVDEFTTAIPEHSDLKPSDYWDKRARGLGSTPARPAVSCGEENLLGYKGDPYSTENIFVHEFAHSIHQQGLAKTDPTFQKRLEGSFAKARLKGLWKGKYANTNPAEYWAEGVQSWFDTNRENDHDHNHVNTREELKAHDSGLAALCEEVFGDTEWRYQRPPARKDGAPHLAGYDVEKAPVFEWPAELIAAYAAIEAGKNLEKTKPLDLKELDDPKLVSPSGGKSVQLRFHNKTKGTLKLFWIGFDGKKRAHGQIDPGRTSVQGTYSGHLWLLLGEKDQPVALFPTPDSDGLAEIE